MVKEYILSPITTIIIHHNLKKTYMHSGVSVRRKKPLFLRNIRQSLLAKYFYSPGISSNSPPTSALNVEERGPQDTETTAAGEPLGCNGTGL